MEITQCQRIKIEEILDGIKCPYNFRCYKSGFAMVGTVKDNGAKDFLECLEEYAQDCEFSLCFGQASHCLCPARIYIAKELKK